MSPKNWKILIREGVSIEIMKESSIEEDAWDNLDINTASVDTGYRRLCRKPWSLLIRITQEIMRSIFVDTSVLITIGNRRDAFHSQVIKINAMD